MNSGLEQAVAQIREGGLPSTEQMRQDNDEINKLLIEKKLGEYALLFNRFTSGENLTDEETKKLTDLSDELHKMSENFGTKS